VTHELRIRVGERTGDVSALLDRPARAFALYVFGHGAGAGMRHAFMQDVAARLAEHDIATLRYQFPYLEHASRRPDPQPVLFATVRAAVGAARDAAPGLPLFAGGKSMGGRMSSLAAAAEALPGVLGLTFFGFPLHPPRRPGTERADHLQRVSLPMLFLQGTRDELAHLDLLRPVLENIGTRARLHIVDGADHGFHVLKRSGRSDADVLDDICNAAVDWMRAIARA
jgi:hypothetical protein